MFKHRSAMLALLLLLVLPAAFAADGETTAYYGQSSEGTAALTHFRDADGAQRLKLYIDLSDKTIRVTAGMDDTLPRATGNWSPLSGGGFAYVRIRSETAEYVLYAGIGRFEEGSDEPVSVSGLVITNQEGRRHLDFSQDCMSALGGNLFDSLGLPADDQDFDLPLEDMPLTVPAAPSVPSGPGQSDPALDALTAFLAEDIAAVNAAGRKAVFRETGSVKLDGVNARTFAFGEDTPEKLTVTGHYAVTPEGRVSRLDGPDGPADGTRPQTLYTPPGAKPEWRDMVVTFLNSTPYEIVAITCGVAMDDGVGFGWERTNTLPWRASDIMLNHVLGLLHIELDLGTVRVAFDDLAPLGGRADPVLMLKQEDGVFTLRLEDPESEDSVVLPGKVERLVDENIRNPVAFADALAAESMTDLRRLAGIAAEAEPDQDEVHMLTLNARIGGDSWAALALPAFDAADPDSEDIPVAEISFRATYSRERLQRAVDAITSLGYRPWMLIRFETDDPYEDMEAAGLVDFTQLPAGSGDVREAVLSELTFERPPNRAIEAQAMFLSSGLYAEAEAGEDFSSGPGFTLRVGSSNLLEILYFPDCSGSADLMQGGILP